jgi:hypothetical protein
MHGPRSEGCRAAPRLTALQFSLCHPSLCLPRTASLILNILVQAFRSAVGKSVKSSSGSERGIVKGQDMREQYLGQASDRNQLSLVDEVADEDRRDGDGS